MQLTCKINISLKKRNGKIFNPKAARKEVEEAIHISNKKQIIKHQ
jgi:hypothetical protein